MINIKRIYERPEKQDGYRILVDRLWPRGMSKEKARLNLWLKEIGPSNGLRKWFGHDSKKWAEFQKRYKEELRSKREITNQIRAIEKNMKKVTLLFSAKDETHNNAVVLREFLSKIMTFR